MSEYTPTTEQVKRIYVRAARQAFIASTGEHEEEFDRWLKAEVDLAKIEGIQMAAEYLVRKDQFTMRTLDLLDELESDFGKRVGIVE